MVPDDLRYSREHEWVRTEKDIAIIGITEYAQSELGDIVFVDLPNVGTNVSATNPVATIEAVKAVSDFFTPISGEIVEINELINEEPSIINRDPYGDGWIVIVKMDKPEELDELLSPEEYKDLIGE